MDVRFAMSLDALNLKHYRPNIALCAGAQLGLE